MPHAAMPFPAGRPRIGITMDVGAPPNGDQRKLLELPADYADAIIRAGGLPILLPITDQSDLRQEMISSIDGLLIPGGRDANPKLYGQPQHPTTKLVDPQREAFDLAMLSLAEQREMPTLGICLGSQMMNIHRGGTLHQHLPDIEASGGKAIVHSRSGDRSNFHAVALRSGSRLADALGTLTLDTNSRHHQGFARIGERLVATAHAPDGLVEAFEDPTLPFWVAVQWHPENLPGTPHEAVFRALVDACRRGKKSEDRSQQ